MAKIELTPEDLAAFREFVGEVYIMRQAQQAYDVVASGTHLSKKLEFEARVDSGLNALIPENVREEWTKGKEASNG